MAEKRDGKDEVTDGEKWKRNDAKSGKWHEMIFASQFSMESKHEDKSSIVSSILASLVCKLTGLLNAHF